MPHPPEVWSRALRRLETDTPEYALEAWIRPLAASGSDAELRLQTDSPLVLERVERQYLKAVREVVRAEGGGQVELELVAVGSLQSRPQSPQAGGKRAMPGTPDEPEESPRGKVATLRGRHTAPRPTPTRVPAAAEPASRAPVPVEAAVHAPVQPPLPHSFDSFVVGPANVLAREAIWALAQGRRLGDGPVFVYSESGLGKTHLSHALAEEAGRQRAARVVYVSAEGFTNQLMAAIRSRNTEPFKRRYRHHCDLLVIEDVQFFGGKKSTQLELFHTLEHLRAVGGRVLLTGDGLPREMEGLDPRLRSEMASGLVAEIEPPDASLRRAILRARAAAAGVRLPEPCLDRLVDAIRGSVRDLEGVLTQLVVSSSLLKQPIDLDLTEAALLKLQPTHVDPGDQAARLEDVIGIVAAFFGTTPDALSARTRRRAIAHPRQLAMYLAHRCTDASHSEIGRALGRAHSSVAHAIKAVERDVMARAPLRYQVEELASRIQARRDAEPGPGAGGP